MSRRSLRLRGKLILVSLVLVCIPLAVVWSIGLYERFARTRLESEVRAAATALQGELSQRLAAGTTVAALGAWLERRAEIEHVLVRLIDRRGKAIFGTDPRHAERWSNVQRGWFRRAGDFFFGPSGPPDLRAYEAALPPPARRPEVQRALAGGSAEIWRFARDRRMVAFYCAAPLAEDDLGAVYLTRISRRSIRALYDVRYQLLKLTLFLAGIAAVMGLWVGWRFVNPLVRLQRAIRQVLHHPAEVDPDRLALHRGDEIGDLSRDLRQLTATMKRQVEQRSAVAADLAHDLKSPISTVTASAELLAGDGPLDPDRRQRLARALLQSSEHMDRSVQGLLDLARLEQHLASQPRAAVDLGALVERLVARYRRDPATGRVTFETELDRGLRVHGIAVQLEQLVRTLLDNAVAFCRARVSLTLRPAQGQVVLRVADDGPGISAGDRDRLFRRFFTNRPPEAPPGTGLGLAIARAIALAHGGRIECDPDGAGSLSGASFTVRLPVEPSR